MTMKDETPRAFRTQEVYQECLRFVAEKHHEQKVPGSDLPYLVHLCNVCMEVMAALPHSEGVDGDLAIRAALLHDCLEDTPTPPQALEKRYGSDLVQTVAALTKNEDLPKEERMADSLGRIKAAGTVAAMVKLADRITNLQEPPSFWSPAKRKAYQAEARQIHEALGELHPWLGKRLEAKIEAYGQWC